MSYQEDVQRYHELMAQGVPPRDAFFTVWPDGLQGAADKRAKEESKKQQDDQLAGVAGTVAGAVATQQAIKHAPSLWEDKPADTTTTTNTETKPQPTQQAEIPADAPTGTNADYEAAGIDPANVPSYGGEPQVIAPGSAVPDGYTAVGTDVMPDGSQGTAIVPNENIQADGSINFGAYAQGAGGALALYNAYKRYEEGDYVGSGISAAQGAAAIGAAAGSATAASVVPYASYASGSYNAHKAIHDGSRTRDEKGAEVAKQAGLMVADAFTGGLASLGDAAFRSTGWGRKWGNKIDKATAKYSLGAHAIGSVMGGLDTKYTQLKNTRNLIKQAEKLKEEDPNSQYLDYITGARQNTFNEDIRGAQKDSGLYYAGKYKTFDEYKAAGLEAADLTHVLGNLETFGPEWADLTEEQRQVVTQALINEDMYISDKGEVNIRKENRDRAKTIFNTIKDVGFDPAFVELPPQAPPPPEQINQDNGDPMQNNKMLIQQPGFDGVAYNNLPPGQQMQLLNSPGYRGPQPTGQIDPNMQNPYADFQMGMGQSQPQNTGYIGPNAASKYPSIREYLASMQQGGQTPMPQMSVPAQSGTQGVGQTGPGATASPMAQQAISQAVPYQAPAPAQGPSQDQIRRSLTMAALERARQRKD